MSKVKVYNLAGKEVGEVTLDPKIFGLKVNENLVFQALRVFEGNERQAYAHTKTKGEVRGGGKKPWRQKGTGRARQGSIRSPQWKGGGVVFGPRSDRNFSLDINKEMKKKAILMALSDKAASNQVLVVDSFGLNAPKTKEIAQALKTLKIAPSSALLTHSESNPSLVRASKNIKKVTVTRANSLNVRDILKHKFLVLDKESLPVIEKTFVK